VAAETLSVTTQNRAVRPGDRVPVMGRWSAAISASMKATVTRKRARASKSERGGVCRIDQLPMPYSRVRVTKSRGQTTDRPELCGWSKRQNSAPRADRAVPSTGSAASICPPWWAWLYWVRTSVPSACLKEARWDEWVYIVQLALAADRLPLCTVISVPRPITIRPVHRGAQRVVMKGGAVIEAAARVTHVAFDKTGTLTHGKPASDRCANHRRSETGLLAPCRRSREAARATRWAKPFAAR